MEMARENQKIGSCHATLGQGAKPNPGSLSKVAELVPFALSLSKGDPYQRQHS
jgi:hypothetical protein